MAQVTVNMIWYGIKKISMMWNSSTIRSVPTSGNFECFSIHSHLAIEKLCFALCFPTHIHPSLFQIFRITENRLAKSGQNENPLVSRSVKSGLKKFNLLARTVKSGFKKIPPVSRSARSGHNKCLVVSRAAKSGYEELSNTCLKRHQNAG